MIAPTLSTKWRMVTLNEVAAPVQNAIVDGPFGSNLKLDDYVPEGVPVLQGKNITDDTFRWLDVRFIPSRKAEELKRSSVRIGDILMVKLGSIGYSAILDDINGFDHAIIPANLAKVTPDLSKVDLHFLHRWLTSTATKEYLVRAASKTAQPALSLGKIKGLPVPLPPLPEQRRIAEILDKADALRASRRTALAQLDTFTQAIFLDMFGDPATNPKGWPVAALRSLGRVTTGRTPPSANEGMFDGAIPFITPGDLESDQPIKRTVTDAGAEASRTVDAGATLVCCIGTIGKIGKSNMRSAFNQQINAVEWDERMQAEYGSAVMRFFKPTIIAWGSSTTLPILKKSSFEQIEIPVPPVTDQQEFALRIERIERVRTTHRVALSTSNELFGALQVMAFRGAL